MFFCVVLLCIFGVLFYYFFERLEVKVLFDCLLMLFEFYFWCDCGFIELLCVLWLLLDDDVFIW